MFFVKMIRLIPLVAILLLVGVIIYLVAQARYNPAKAKLIVIKISTGVCVALTAFFLLWCLYALLEKNGGVFDLFLSFAAVPAFGLVITLICRAVFMHHHPKYKDKTYRDENGITFKKFWSKKLKNAAKNYVEKKFGGGGKR